MWLLLGLVALSLSMALGYLMRRISAWKGERFVAHHLGSDQHARTINADYAVSKGKHGRYIGCRLAVSGAIGGRDPIAFKLRRENWFDRFGKHIGVTKEQRLGDRRLDEQLFLDSNDQRVGLLFQRSETARAALANVRAGVGAERIKALYAHGGRMWIELNGQGVEPDDALKSQTAITLDALLESLQSAFSQFAADRSAVGGRDPFIWRAAMLLAISTGSLMFGFLALIRNKFVAEQLDPHQLWFYALGLGLVMTFVLFVFAWRLLHASTRAHVVLAEIATLGLIGFFLTSKALLTEANMELDQKPAEVMLISRPQVEHITYRCGKNNRNTCHRYTLAVSPEKFTGRHSISIHSEIYEQLRNQPAAIVKIKPGALGVKWIESVTSESPLAAEQTP